MAMLDGIKVLIVEDEFLIGLEMQLILEGEGAAVTLAATLEEGLAAAENGIDVAVLDVRLRDVDVFPIAERLIARGKPLIFHSGHADTVELERRYSGAVALSKPARPRMLLEAVSRQAA